MTIFEQIIRIYAPFSCVSCENESDTLLCSACDEQLPTVPSRCYKCKAATRGYATCDACRARSPLQSVYVATHYTDIPKELLKRVKYERAKSGVEPLARRMSALLPAADDTTMLVPVPTATSRVRLRGYDQAVLLSRSIARYTKIEKALYLDRLGQAHQVGARRSERLRHLEGAFRIKSGVTVKNRHIILVDDVLTTGATLETAAKLLKNAGAKQVDAVVFAQAS